MKIVTRISFLVALIIPSTGFCGNPFNKLTPTDVGTTAQSIVPITKEIDPERHPLVRWTLDQYVIMGVLLSEDRRIAIVRTPQPHLQSYLLYIGDSLGDEDCVVRSIDKSGITMLESCSELPKEIRLEVRNKGVKTKDD